MFTDRFFSFRVHLEFKGRLELRLVTIFFARQTIENLSAALYLIRL